METNIDGPSGSIHITSEETSIKGPSGEIRINNGIKSGDTLSQGLADKIVSQGGGDFTISEEGEGKYLMGPDGFKVKIGDKLKEDQIKLLSKYVPDVVKGGVDNKKGDNKSPPPLSGDSKAPGAGTTPQDSSAPAPATPPKNPNA